MAIVPQIVQGSYDAALFDFIAKSEGFVARVYSDHRGIPTLGLGYALLVDAPGWPKRQGLGDDLSAIGVTLSEADEALLDSLSRALAGGAVDEAKALVAPWKPGEDPAAGNAFSFLITREQGRALFERIRPDYEGILTQRLGRPLLQALAGSQELMVLFSLTYNSPALIGPGLTAALREGARERAWYEIRFGSNRERHRGLQNRRDHEAEMFGALNAQPTAAEQLAFLQLIDTRRDKITRYLGQVGLERDGIETVLAGLEDSARTTRLA
ncbi:lysozyme [Pelagibius litoralis]|uniref:Lysozyme n=1 Tax=Pelagibius litoralis TaxID=374515 RepID=A0A967F0W4_9PROT|nr:lysozyme [Pelagibius litoralis]NIA70945.1 lysozyme [Pelagibius litoralis]